ncbi:tetratricopeptide repeat protein [Streptomyces sp. NPDC055749]
MDVMPQQDPESRQPPPETYASPASPAGATALPPEGATAAPLPPPTLRTTLRRAAFGAVAAAVLVAGAVVAVPENRRDAGPRVPSPVERARAATTAGSPAALSDLTALITDRRKWVAQHPKDAPSWAVLGSAYVEWGLRSADAAYYTRAEEALRRSLAAQPGERGNGDAWVGMAALANARHDYLAARKWGEAVRERQPKTWRTYPVLIDAYNGLGDYEAAGAATEKFAELRKGVPALVRTAGMYRDRGWREDALATAQEAADRATAPAEKAEALYRLGELAWERGELEEAVAQYGAALRTDSGHHPSRAGRARALVALDRTDEALSDYQTAVAKHPRPEYVLELGELYESLGFDGDALTQYTELRAMLTRAKTAGVNETLVLARLETDHGDPAAAVELLRTEWSHRHRSAAVADALGWALHRSGDSAQALEYARKAMETGVRNASYAYHLGVIERELAQYGTARRHLEEALRTNPAFSPLAAPLAEDALNTLGDPADGGPQDMQPAAPPAQAPSPEPEPEPTKEAPAPPRKASPAPSPKPSGAATKVAPAPTPSARPSAGQ